MNPLQQGSTGADVAKLQTSLKSAGFDPGNIDSAFGPKTAAALSAYQTANGLKADSIFGPITSGKLYGSAGAGSGAGTVASSNGKSPLDLATTMDASGKPADDSSNQYNTSTGQPNPKYVAPTNGPTIGTSDSARTAALQKIKDDMNAGLTTPTPYKSVDEFQKLRTEQGVVQDESELASIKNEAAQLKETLNQFNQTAGEGTSESGALGMMSEAQRNAQFKLDSLALRETAVTDRLNTKNSYISTVLSLGKDDYQTAYTNYTNEYNKNVKAVDLYNTQASDVQKDALTGFTTITNLLKDSGVTTLDASTSATLDAMALKAGLPAGIFQSVLKSTKDEKILAPVMVDTATGKDIYFYTQDKNGVPSLKTVQHLAGKGTDEKFKGYSGSDVVAIKKDIQENGLDKVIAGITDPDQVKAIQDIAKDVTKTTTKLTRESLSSLYGIPDDGGKTGFLGFGKTNSEKLDELVASIKKYQDVGYSDDDILKLINKQ